MRAIFIVLSMLGLLGLASCSKFKTYNGPEVTRVIVLKEERTMYLMHNDTVLETYPFDLGFTPAGHKERYGDGRTPEGTYIIDRKNPESSYHLSLGISYPDVHDRTAAKEAGDNPGGDIFIHGGPTERRDRGKADWTAGCIAVNDRQIEDIYSMVRIGTPIDIYASATTPLSGEGSGDGSDVEASAADEQSPPDLAVGVLVPGEAEVSRAGVEDDLPGVLLGHPG